MLAMWLEHSRPSQVGMALRGRSGCWPPVGHEGPTHTASAGPQFLHQLARNFFKKPGGHAGFRHVRAISPAIDGASEHQLVHGAGHADVAKAPLFLDVIRI